MDVRNCLILAYLIMPLTPSACHATGKDSTHARYNTTLGTEALKYIAPPNEWAKKHAEFVWSILEKKDKAKHLATRVHTSPLREENAPIKGHGEVGNGDE